MDNLRLQIMTFYRDHVKRYLAELDKEQQQKLVGSFYIVLTLFTVAFFGFFAINPTLSTIASLQKQHEDSVALDEQMKNKIDSLGKLDGAYQKLGPTLDALYRAIPKSPEIPLFTRKVEQIALESAVILMRFNTGQIELYPANSTQEPLYSFSYSMLVQGTNDAQLEQFLSDIISFDRLITVESISKNVTEENGTTLSVSGKIYFQK